MSTPNAKTPPKPLTAQLSQLEDGPRVARRVVIHADVLKTMRVFAGDAVSISPSPTAGPPKPGSGPFALGTAWPSLDIAPDSIQLSPSLLYTAGIQEGAQAYVTAAQQPKRHAATVTLREVEPPSDTDKEKKSEWLLLQIRETLVDLRYITPSQAVVVQHEGRRRVFIVQSVSAARETGLGDELDKLTTELSSLSVSSAQPARKDVWSASWDTTVRLVDPPKPVQPELKEEDDEDAAESPYATVGGLDAQVTAVRDLIDIPLRHPALFEQFNLSPPRGLLLYGPPGTGKTHLARAIAKAAKASVIVVNGPELCGAFHGETEGRLRSIFEDARKKSPCVIVLDEVDALCPRRDDAGEAERRTVATLLTLMDGMDAKTADAHATRVVVVATTNRPNAIDPALRRPGRFDREIEIGVPDVAARLQILNVLLVRTPHTLSRSFLISLSTRLHGFVGADIAALIRSAGTLAIHRRSSTLDACDIDRALPSVRPSALREIEVEGAVGVGTRWDDVGGMQNVRTVLEQAVVWPLKHREAFERLGVRGARGVLMYGPPGCSKTLVARALAGEGGVNFVAVRGAELLSKYVGESERAVREVFRKARAASPCVIFFDELDALGSTRDDVRASAHVGVLTTLLNEMDGVQAMNGVVVVAATNRPQIIDPALLRPGRLDRVLFVGPPDVRARQEIVRVHTRKMAVDPALDVDALAAMTEGCSGAEIAAMCQDAALRAMGRDINVRFIAQEDFVAAAKSARRGITREMIAEYREWQRTSGVPPI